MQSPRALAEDDVERVRVLLTSTVGVLCRNSLRYGCELKVQGLIGVTVDSKNVFLVSINEVFCSDKLSSKEQESRTSGGNLIDEPVKTTDKTLDSSSSPIPRQPASALHVSDNARVLSAGQLPSRNAQDLPNVSNKLEVEVSSVYSLAQLSSGNVQLRNGMQSGKLNRQQSAQKDDVLIGNLKHAKNNETEQCVDQSSNAEFVDGICDSLIQQQPLTFSVEDAVDHFRCQTSDGMLLPKSRTVNQQNENAAVGSSDLINTDDIIFVKREVRSPALMVTTGSGTCTVDAADGGENMSDNNDNDDERSGHSLIHVTDGFSSGQPHWQHQPQYDFASDWNYTGQTYDPLWKARHYQMVRRDRTGVNSRAIHQCEYAGCGLRFCHRRHLLRHQTLKHGRPKGRGGRMTTCFSTVESASSHDETLLTADEGLTFDDVGART